MRTYAESRERKRRHGWRWWRWDYRWGGRRLHSRPHVGPRRLRRVVVSEGDLVWTERRAARGRRLALQKPPFTLYLETVEVGPYEEHYAGWRAAWWYERRVLRHRARRGWDGPDRWRGLYRPHPLQSGRR